jgi:hypothetical protein
VTRRCSTTPAHSKDPRAAVFLRLTNPDRAARIRTMKHAEVQEISVEGQLLVREERSRELEPTELPPYPSSGTPEPQGMIR